MKGLITIISIVTLSAFGQEVVYKDIDGFENYEHVEMYPDSADSGEKIWSYFGPVMAYRNDLVNQENIVSVYNETVRVLDIYGFGFADPDRKLESSSMLDDLGPGSMYLWLSLSTDYEHFYRGWTLIDEEDYYIEATFMLDNEEVEFRVSHYTK